MVLWAAPLAAADKVDVVHLKNGDRLTCEIKQLDRSMLTVSTDPMGTISVHWGEVAGLTSPRNFDVQVASGQHHYGSFLPAPEGLLILDVGGGATSTLPLSELIRLVPIGSSFWNRVDGNIDAGFSFTQANVETRYTLNGNAQYRSIKYLFNSSIASQLTTSEDSDDVRRNTISLLGSRSFGNHWYTIAWAQFQQNEELALDLRVVGGGGIGRDLVHTARRLWTTYGGLAYTHERFSGEPDDQSVEAALGGQLEFFSPNNDDYNITNSVISYINLSGRARVRFELQSAWRHKFLKDFYWSVNTFESFDGDPPADEKKNDFGVSIALGWKF